MANLFNLEILTPDRVFFTGEVESLVLNTPTGEMGILHGTLPLVAVLQSGVMRILQSNKWMEAVNADGFVRVASDKVTILAEMCEWPYEINASKVGEEIMGLNDKVRKAQSMKEYKMAKAQLAIQLAKLKVKGHDL